MYEYEIFEEELYNVDLGKYITYGIIGILSGEKVCKMSDVSVSKKQAEEVARLCNRVNLSPVHLEDVVFDYIE